MEENNYRRPNPRRRRRTKWDIIKEAYLPTIFLIITAVFLIAIIAGSLSRKQDAAETTPPETSSTAATEDLYAEQVQRLLARTAELAKDYDYEGAVTLISTFSGDITQYPDLQAALEEYQQAAASMVSWSASQVKALSFHMLIADAERAFSNHAFGAAYKKNFVTTEEFKSILQQLYDNGYILVSLEDFTSRNGADPAGADASFAEKELRLPVGKKPLLLVQTNVSYYTYMIDGNGDGLADKDGAGFASKLLVDDNGKITSELVDRDGNTLQGDYDLVPILEDFIAGHPDFSYRSARAVLAPSGYNGIFGYRINPSVKSTKGEAYYNEQVDSATKLVAALREKGYELACYTYGNSAYGVISAGEIQSDLRSWASEITPIFGETDILVFAQNSQIEEYTGAKFNVLYNAGFRYFLGFDTGTLVTESFVRQNRIMVTGSLMADTPAIYSGLFDPHSVLDPLRTEINED